MLAEEPAFRWTEPQEVLAMRSAFGCSTSSVGRLMKWYSLNCHLNVLLSVTSAATKSITALMAGARRRSV